jgi:pilus assembly protein Flp/PilA
VLSIIPPLVKDKGGVAAIECGLLAALIAVAAISVIGTVGTSLNNTFSTVANNL